MRRIFGLGPGLALLAALVVATPAESATLIDDDNHLWVVSLGDSYIAGNGADPGSYYDGQGPGQGDIPNEPRVPALGVNCHQNYASYPWLYTERLRSAGLSADIWHAACAGAWTNDLKAQLDTVPNDIVAQADIVLISAGGNNLGFDKLVVHCILDWPGVVPGVGSTCGRHLDAAEAGLDPTLDDLRSKLVSIAGEVPSDTRIVVAGYPNLISPNCPTAVGRDRINGLYERHQVELTRMISELSRSHGSRFHYVNPIVTFWDHGPCRADNSADGRWVNPGVIEAGAGVHELAENLIKSESFHLNPIGHQRYADLIFDQHIHTRLQTTAPESADPPIDPDLGDGRDDLLVRRNDGEWRAYDTVNNSWHFDVANTGYSIDIIQWADVVGDGRDDLLVRRNDGEWRAYDTVNNSWHFDVANTGYSIDIIQWADVVGDGRDDLLVRRNDGEWRAYDTVNNSWHFDVANTGYSIDIIQWADVVGDGRDDLLVRRNDGEWRAYDTVNNSWHFDVANTGYSIDIIQWADVVGDGRDDLLVRRNDGEWRAYDTVNNSWHFDVANTGYSIDIIQWADIVS